MFATVIDMRLLVKLGAALATSSATIITTLAAIGTGQQLAMEGNATHA